MVNCLICQEPFEDDTRLHKHLKVHKLHVFEYYQKTSPRIDPFDGSMIAFKNKKQYFNTDFNSVQNMRQWLEQQPIYKRREYMSNILIKRLYEKKLIYAPTQVELRSLKMPGINYYNQVFENYYVLTASLGLFNRYSFIKKLIFNDIFITGAKIFIDSREQLPLKFDCDTEVQGLKFGDYSFHQPIKSGNCFVERKSMNDLIGTLSGGFDRFEREIIRAKEAGAYLVVLVEEDLANAIKFNLLSSVYHKTMKVTPEFVFHNVRKLIQKYDCLQFLFVKDRNKAAEMVKKLFCLGEQVRQIDLQYYLDKGLV